MRGAIANHAGYLSTPFCGERDHAEGECSSRARRLISFDGPAIKIEYTNDAAHCMKFKLTMSLNFNGENVMPHTMHR